MSRDKARHWSRRFDSAGVDETIEIGRRIGRVLAAGDAVGLIGPLGAGKTQLAKGLAVGLDVSDRDRVNSPTFVLVNEYDGRLHIFHVDAYRLSGPAELSALGFEEFCDGGAVVVVEWADRVAGLLPDRTVWITLSPTGETRRRLLLRTASAELAKRLDGASLSATSS
ncbi:MAG: tRNA (adenosine(37)-N6)-threonylcarbamoyltransferase complex ATPase subunit type 1 TsaE [Phycisphaerae bacterium]